MCRGRGAAYILAIATVALSGCIGTQTNPQTVMSRLRAVGGPQGPDVVVIDVAILELPPGDAFVDRDLWSAVDEQAVALDRKAILEDNGFRVGLVGGMPPPQLQQLLESERTSPSPHRVQMRSGDVKLLPVGTLRDDCSFEFQGDGEPKSMKLVQAQCGLIVVPQRTDDGRVRLTLTPQVQHGGKSVFIQPAEGEGWSLGGQRPAEKYAGLAFDVTLSPKEYLIVGTRYDRRKTLGHVAFVSNTAEKPVQRLLVIRSRPQGDAPAADLNWSDGKSAPLALQAAKSVRGQAE